MLKLSLTKNTRFAVFEVISTMIITFVSGILTRLKNYSKMNWGFPFIIAFMSLLVLVAVSLLIGMYSFADLIAVYAYYALVVGIILQLVCYFKYRRADGNQADITNQSGYTGNTIQNINEKNSIKEL